MIQVVSRLYALRVA